MAPGSRRSDAYRSSALAPSWTPPLKVFFALQLTDVLTTAVFRSMGISETNPMIAWMMDRFGTLGGLLMIKSLAISIGMGCGIAAHPRFVRWINAVYFAIVSVNFLTICYAARG